MAYSSTLTKTKVTLTGCCCFFQASKEGLDLDDFLTQDYKVSPLKQYHNSYSIFKLSFTFRSLCENYADRNFNNNFKDLLNIFSPP